MVGETPTLEYNIAVKIDYDAIAQVYARNRRINARTLERLLQLGRLEKSSRVLEVGCGSGNYSSAIANLIGCNCHGLEPSEGMLAKAKAQNAAVVWTQGDAHTLSYPNNSFDFLFCVDVIHHVPNTKLLLNEAFRVLTAEGRLCIASDSEWTIRNRHPLSVYFPETIEKELERYPSPERLKTLLTECGFSEANDEIVELPYQLERADAYKEKSFSCLQLISESAFLTGLHAMERDLSRGPISCVDRHAVLSATKKE